MGGVLGGVDSDFTFKMIIFAVAILFILPTLMSVYAGGQAEADENVEDLLDDYYDFTGTNAVSESVWALTGIYTPYTGTTTYGYTDDGWLYGSVVGEGTGTYTPDQYVGTSQTYSVQRGEGGLYRYTSDSADGHVTGDLYTNVSFDTGHKSDIFFTEAGKVESGDFFYYEYTGYRYAFQPLANYNAENSEGNPIPVVANTTSLSLIWYEYYGSSGISGQLILSGSDGGVAYLTAQQIVTAFSSTTSTATFSMTFNNVDMRVHIRIDPYYLSQGFSIEECYNLGYWSVMVSSLSTDIDAYNTTEYSFNIYNIFETLIDLFTFDTSDYGISGTMGTIASLVLVVPLYAALIVIGMNFYPALILAGVLAAIQAIASIF